MPTRSHARRTRTQHAIAGGSSRLLAMAGRGGHRAWHREPGTMPGYGVPVGLGERAGGEQCPAVRTERLAAVREWVEVGLPQVLLHRALLRRRQARRAALGQPEAGSAGGGPGAAVLRVGRSRSGLRPWVADSRELGCQCRSWPAKLSRHSTWARTSAYPVDVCRIAGSQLGSQR